jgi:hypothetical protein
MRKALLAALPLLAHRSGKAPWQRERARMAGGVSSGATNWKDNMPQNPSFEGYNAKSYSLLIALDDNDK